MTNKAEIKITLNAPFPIPKEAKEAYSRGAKFVQYPIMTVFGPIVITVDSLEWKDD